MSDSYLLDISMKLPCLILSLFWLVFHHVLLAFFSCRSVFFSMFLRWKLRQIEEMLERIVKNKKKRKPKNASAISLLLLLLLHHHHHVIFFLALLLSTTIDDDTTAYALLVINTNSCRNYSTSSFLLFLSLSVSRFCSSCCTGYLRRNHQSIDRSIDWLIYSILDRD